MNLIGKRTVHMRQTQEYRAEARKIDDAQPKPEVEIIWRDDAGTHRKYLPWRHSLAEAALTGWIEDYFDMVEHGYHPQGFDRPPLPHCARITLRGQVFAEWHRDLSPSFSVESPVTADEREGSGGIPTAAPSAPSSECLAVPTLPAPCRKDSGGNDRDPSNVTRVEPGRTVAKAGRPLER